MGKNAATAEAAVASRGKSVGGTLGACCCHNPQGEWKVGQCHTDSWPMLSHALAVHCCDCIHGAMFAAGHLAKTARSSLLMSVFQCAACVAMKLLPKHL